MSGNGNGNGNGKPRVPTLTPEQEERLIDAIRLGMPIRRACRMVGITTSLYYRLMEAGEQAESGKAKEFMEQLTRARDEGEYGLLKRIEAGGKGTGNLLWILEHAFGYVKTERREVDQKTEHSGKVGLDTNAIWTDPPRPEKKEAGDAGEG